VSGARLQNLRSNAASPGFSATMPGLDGLRKSTNSRTSPGLIFWNSQPLLSNAFAKAGFGLSEESPSLQRFSGRSGVTPAFTLV
jgi:hypothetical protein